MVINKLVCIFISFIIVCPMQCIAAWTEYKIIWCVVSGIQSVWTRLSCHLWTNLQ